VASEKRERSVNWGLEEEEKKQSTPPRGTVRGFLPVNWVYEGTEKETRKRKSGGVVSGNPTG